MTYRTTTVEELFPDVHEYKRVWLYVYSVDNNPDGAIKGTNAQLLGDADNYTTAADLWFAARSAAVALGAGSDSIGLCVFEPTEGAN